MSDDNYNPNSFTAVLSRLETGILNCGEALGSLRTEFKEAHVRLHERLDMHEKDLVDLKTNEAVRDKQVKLAVAIIAVIGWGVNALITWKRGA